MFHWLMKRLFLLSLTIGIVGFDDPKEGEDSEESDSENTDSEEEDSEEEEESDEEEGSEEEDSEEEGKKSGKKGKKVHEYTFEEADDVRWRRRAVHVSVKGPKGKVIFEYKPFGAASRLFNWLKEQKEERRRLAKGEVENLYERGKSSG